MKFFGLLNLLCLFQISYSTTKMFGDSILASNTPIQTDLERYGQIVIDNYARIGAGLQPGWVISIPEQYQQNKYPIPSTIIVDGGGNDVNGFKYDCEAFNDNCRNSIDRLVVILKDLFETMRKDGVENIIYIGFYYLGRLNNSIDYATDKIQQVCKPTDHCYHIDLRNITVHTGWDGVHPVTSSYHDIATEIWKRKVHYNIPLT